MKSTFLILFSTILSGCMHIDQIAKDQKPIGLWGLNCNKPYTFTRNCFEENEEQLFIYINNHKIILSASEDERTVIFFGNNSRIDPYSLFDLQSKDSANILNYIKNELKNNYGVTLLRAAPVTFMRDVLGYVMEFDVPAYNQVIALGTPSNK